MKREAWDHPKFKLLARDLGLPLCYARGIVESLWLVAQISMPRGDIGRWSNDELAIAIDYPGDADELIAALLKRRLIDADPACRLIVHDWAEHADALVHRRLARSGQDFANGTPPNLKQCTPSERKQYADRKKTPENHHDVYTPNIRSSPAVSGIGIGIEKSSSGDDAADDGEEIPIPDQIPETDPSVVEIPTERPKPDPLSGEARRLIGTLNRSHEVSARDRPKVIEMIRKFGVNRVAEAFGFANENDAMKPVAYASTILTRKQAEDATPRGPPGDPQFVPPTPEQLKELEKAGVL